MHNYKMYLRLMSGFAFWHKVFYSLGITFLLILLGAGAEIVWTGKSISNFNSILLTAIGFLAVFFKLIGMYFFKKSIDKDRDKEFNFISLDKSKKPSSCEISFTDPKTGEEKTATLHPFTHD